LPSSVVLPLVLGGSVAASQTAHLVADLAPGETGIAGLAPVSFVSLGNRTLFIADGTTEGTLPPSHQLWVTDGTAAGTQRLPDLCLDSCYRDPQFLTQIGGVAFFAETTSLDQFGPAQLWRTDGTRAGTRYFWFFAAGNVETVLKVIDGRSLNGHLWVFYGALSDVQYTLTVTDTATGATRTYDNPAGQFASIADTTAF
jgi:ELWxxDGT repeat protein